MTQANPDRSLDTGAARADERLLRIFSERLFARLPAELAATMPAAQRKEVARAAFDFMRMRATPVKVRVLAQEDALTVVESTMPDCPFIVDSLLEYFHSLGAPVRVLLHPVFNIARDSEGRIVSFEQAQSSERGESMVHAEIELQASPGRIAEIAAETERVLAAVHEATSDFERMTARALEICEETAAARELVEVRDFLRWLVQGGFVFLGYRRYTLEARGARRSITVAGGSGLGILSAELRSRFAAATALSDLTSAQQKLMLEGSVLIIGKTRARSPVHRFAAMDDIAIRRVDERGRPAAIDRFLGLFTSKAYAEEAQHIPVLRAKLAEVIRLEEVKPGSHDFKDLVATFNSFPKEELFRAPVNELRVQLRVILDLKRDDQVRLLVHADPIRGNVIVLVVMPRERFSAQVRTRIQDLLGERLGGAVVYYYLALGDSLTARLHFCFAAPPPAPAGIPALEAEVAALARTWEDRLREHLIERFGAARGRVLAARWAQAFGAEYQATTDVARAASDLEHIEQLLGGGAPAVEVSPPRAAGEPVELRFFELGEPPVLSDLMPVLQNFGLRVLSEDVHELRARGEGGGGALRASVQSFRVMGPPAASQSASLNYGLLAEGLAAVRERQCEDDPLNALALGAGLKSREVALVRAYLGAAFQMRLAPARPALRRVLLNHPGLARVLVDLFVARFDPDQTAPAGRIEQLRGAYLEGLAAVDNIADDRVARVLLAMVEATVRTNYFQAVPALDPYIALKFESARIPHLPDTPPLYEIHVHSPSMEGCHLRAGRIARGGIRYSDRPDDFRAEILGLMKTQTVKNAIIVPIGSKGGFIVKPPSGHVADSQDAVAAYRTLMNAMLDLTDNLVDGKIVHPKRVRVLDNDGPYLVVAADKGTASYSDIANAIAEQRGFWLADAFASGGEHGFDHKKMGITARGAWESARRHLREMGRDPDRGAPITVTGIGDMSGDVFGNGMLQSANLKLIAAFNHRHIFLDPLPDPAASFAERRRLFELKGSSWADYNPALISPGGGVFERARKSIALSPQVRAALGCADDALDGESLIRAILHAGADLLYNGGIGTYVRASDETDAQVGDHANDSCRITASELRARVVVEGGNLGFTQKARIEYALAGGRINTDAIDNSAGVDTSDHEVNLKILVQPAVAGGALKFDERNRVLRAAQEEVAASVLGDNRDQALMLSLEQLRSRTRVHTFREHLQAIEERGLLRRHEEALPSAEALRERHALYAGLTRPELAVVAAYTKLDLIMRLEDSAFVDDDYLVTRFLAPYFPSSIAVRFSAEIARHRLRRQLVATRIINELVDLMGSTFVFSLVSDCGVMAHDAVRAWIMAGDVIGLASQAAKLRAQAPQLEAEAECEALLALERAARKACEWALANSEPALSIGALVGRYGPALLALSANFDSMLAAGDRERFEQLYRELRAVVHREDFALDLARLGFVGHLLEVLSVSFAQDVEPVRAAEAYFGLGATFDFALLERAIEALSGDDRWERRAARELGAELNAARIRLSCAAMSDSDGPMAGIARLRIGREREFDECERLMAELHAMRALTPAALQVAARALSRLSTR